MTELSKIGAFAVQLRNKPWLSDIMAEKQPQVFEQVLRFAQTPFFSWKPFPAQEKFLNDPSRNKWTSAGNRAGKTLCGLIEDVADCLQLDPVTKGLRDRYAHPPKIWIVSDTEDTAVGIVERTLVEGVFGTDESGMLWNYIDSSCKYTAKSGFSQHYIRFTNGASIDIKFSTQDRKVFQGQALDKIHFDEVQPKDIYGECTARLVDRNGYFLGTMTPIFDKRKGVPWIWEDLYLMREEKGIVFHEWSMLDNPHLSQEAKERMMREWDEDELEARIYGRFTPIGVTLAWSPRLMQRIKEDILLPREVTIDAIGKTKKQREVDPGGRGSRALAGDSAGGQVRPRFVGA